MVDNGRAGFTVFELLIALAILGGVVGSLAGILETARRLQFAVEERHQRYGESAQLRGVLVDALSQLRDLPGPAPASRLSGNHRRITLLAEAPRPLGMDQPSILNLAPDEDQLGLVATWRPSAGQASPMSMRLIAADRQVRFNYLALDGGWREGWDPLDTLPALLRVTIEAPDRRTAAVVLQIPLRALTPQTCVYNPDAKRCEPRRP
jgi:prepilin-type N-terminal cleavage/methylation domain-containing protein